MNTQTLLDRRLEDIPLSKIRPNPDNPRGPVDPLEAISMAESLREAGQKTEIRVRPMTDSEKAQYPPYEYLLIGGHVRLAGAQIAKLETLRAVVLDPTNPNQEFLDAVLDNRWRDMSWWKWDLAIERILNADPNLSQRKLAAQLGFAQGKIFRAVKITRALTPQVREKVDQNLRHQAFVEGESDSPRVTQNKGFLITESILLALADLEKPEEVEKAFGRVLEDQMTESQVRQMVQGLKKGSSSKPSKAGSSAIADAVAGTTPIVNSPSQGPETKGGAAINPSPLEGEGRVRGGSGAESTSVVPTSVQSPEPQPAVTPLPSSGLWATLAGLFKSSQGNQALVLGGMGGVVGAFLLSNLKRALGTLTRRYMLHGLAGLGAVAFFATHGFSLFSLSKTTTPKASKSEQAIEVPPEWKDRVDAGRNLATELAMNFYGFDYSDPAVWLDGVNGDLTAGYAPIFFKDYFPPDKMEDIKRLKLNESFEFNQPIQLLALDPDNETFLVRGVAKLKSDLGQGNQVVAQGEVSLEVHVVHTPGGRTQGNVYMVKELATLPYDFTQGRAPSGIVDTPTKKEPKVAKKTKKKASAKEESTAKAQSAPASQTADPAAKFVGDAAGEAAKKVFGF